MLQKLLSKVNGSSSNNSTVDMDTGAGLFLAKHYAMLGPYFGDLDIQNWPHVPLHKEPTSLEEDFHKLLTNFTFLLSNGSVENISLLDLPAFGSTIVTLRKDLRKQFNWPIETNYAILKSNPEVTVSIFTAYKTLMDDWGKYMEQLGKSEDANNFTPEMENNLYMNFTRYIKADMGTFLIATAGTPYHF